MQSIGERLKKTREKQGVTLDEVCVNTKVAVRFLEAIEADKFEKLPGGIFNKGFIRAYAQHLGINDDEAVADYLKAAGLQPTIPLNTTPPGEEPVKFVEPEESEARIISRPKLKPELKPELRRKRRNRSQSRWRWLRQFPFRLRSLRRWWRSGLLGIKTKLRGRRRGRKIATKKKRKKKKKAVQPVRVAPSTLAPAVMTSIGSPGAKSLLRCC